MITDTEEEKALQVHIDRRETLKSCIAAAQEKVDRLLKYADWRPSADDIESSEELDLGLEWQLRFRLSLESDEKPRGY